MVRTADGRAIERRSGPLLRLRNESAVQEIHSDSSERAALERVGLRNLNLYPAFLALAAGLLEEGGQLSAITPRSFANGPYFQEFDDSSYSEWHSEGCTCSSAVGTSSQTRKSSSRDVIFHAIRGESPGTVTLSTSRGYRDEPAIREVDAARVIRPDDPHLFIHIPIDEHATAVAECVATLPAALTEVPLQVSTGRVVDFRGTRVPHPRSRAGAHGAAPHLSHALPRRPRPMAAARR